MLEPYVVKVTRTVLRREGWSNPIPNLSDTIQNNSNLINNQALYYGGAVYSDGNLTINTTNFTNNNVTTIQATLADGYGGGAIFSSDKLIVANSNFTANNVVSYDVEAIANTGYGGAIQVLNASKEVSIQTSNFQDNTALGGGAINIYNSPNSKKNIKNNNFTQNSALQGGAVETYESVNITSNNFTDNEAEYGSMLYATRNVTITGTTINTEHENTLVYVDDDAVITATSNTVNDVLLSERLVQTSIDVADSIAIPENRDTNTTILVVTNDGGVVTSGRVQVFVGDDLISTWSKPTEDGFIVTLSYDTIGDELITIKYSDDTGVYVDSQATTILSVGILPTAIDAIENVTVTVYEQSTVLVVVRDIDGEIVTMGNVTITVDGENITKSVELGGDAFIVTINTDKTGNNTATVKFTDDEGVYTNATTTFNLTVNPIATTIDEVDPLSVVVTSDVQVLVVVRDAYNNILNTGSVKVYKSGNDTELSTDCISSSEGFTVTIHGDKVGSYALDIIYVPAEDVYSSSQTQTTLEVKALDTYIEDITPITTATNTDFTVSVKVVPSEVMTRGSVKLFIGETELDSSRYVVGDESYDITTTTDIVGNNLLTVKFISDDENYADCEITTDISVAKIDTVTTMTPLEAVVNETVTLTANVTGVNGEIINTGKVAFKVNGKTLRDTDGRILYALVLNGTASTDVTALESWTKTDSTIEATYSGSNVTTSSKSDKVSLSVSNPPVPEEAKLEIGELGEASPGDNVTIKVTATGVSGGKVILKVNGKTVKNADGKLYAKLDENGMATFTYYVPKTAKDGNYTVKAVYTDSVYKLYDEETLIVSS